MAADSKKITRNGYGQKKWKRVIMFDYGMQNQDTKEGFVKPYKDQGIAVHHITISGEKTIAWPEDLPLIDEDDKLLTFAHGFLPAQAYVQSDSTQTLLYADELAEIIASHTKQDIERLSISHLSCYGGLGLQPYSPEGSFAACLLHLLSDKGIKNPIITALCHTLVCSELEPKRTLSVFNFPLTTISSENEEINIAHINNIERYARLNFPLKKLSGSKVRLSLSQDGRRKLIATYPYSESQIMKVYELKDDNLQELYPQYAVARDKVKSQAIKALTEVLAETKSAAEAKGLVIPPVIADPIFRLMPNQLSNLYFFDSNTIINFIERNNQNRDDSTVSPELLNWEKDVKEKIEIKRELRFYLSQQEILFSIIEYAVENAKYNLNYMKNKSKFLKQLNYFSSSSIPGLIVRGIKLLYENELLLDAIDRKAFLKLSEKEQHQLAILLSLGPEERDELCEAFPQKLKLILDPVNCLKKIIQAELSAQALKGEFLNEVLVSLSKSSDLNAMKMHIRHAQIIFLEEVILAELNAQALRGENSDEFLVELSKSRNLDKMKAYVKQAKIANHPLPERVASIFKLIEDSSLQNKVEMEIKCYSLKETFRFYTLKDFIKCEFNKDFEEDEFISVKIGSLVAADNLADMKARAKHYLQIENDNLTEEIRSMCQIITDFDSIEDITEALQFYALKEFIKIKFKENLNANTDFHTTVCLLNSQNLAQMKDYARYHLEEFHLGKKAPPLTEKTRMLCEIVMDFDSVEDIRNVLEGKMDIKWELFYTIKRFFKPKVKEIIKASHYDHLPSPQEIDLKSLKGFSRFRLTSGGKPHERAKIVYDIIMASASLEEIRDGILLYKLKALIKAEFKEKASIDKDTYSDPVGFLLQAENLAEMKACANSYLRGQAPLTENTRNICAIVAKSDSIVEITTAILFHAIKELIKFELKEEDCNSPPVHAVMNAQDLVGMKKWANFYLKNDVTNLPEKVKKVCEIVTAFDSIEKIKEILFFHALKEVIKNELKEFKGHYSYVDLLLKARNLDELRTYVNYFLKNIGSLPACIKTFCINLELSGSIEKIKEALKPSVQLYVREGGYSPAAGQGVSRSTQLVHVPPFFPSLPQVEGGMVKSKEEEQLHEFKNFIESELKEFKDHSFHVDKLISAPDLDEFINCASAFLIDKRSLPQKVRIFCKGVVHSNSIDVIKEAILFYTLQEFIKAEYSEKRDCCFLVDHLLKTKNLTEMKEYARGHLENKIGLLPEKIHRIFQSISELGSIDEIKKALYHRIHVETDLSNLIKDLFEKKYKNIFYFGLIQDLSSNNLAAMKATAKFLLESKRTSPGELQRALEAILDSESIEEVRERILLDKLKEFIKVELQASAGEGKSHSDQIVSFLTANNLEKMKSLANHYINQEESALTIKARCVCEMVGKLDSIDEIKMAISFHTIKELIKSEIKKSGVECPQISPLLSALVGVPDLAEMKKMAWFYLQNVGIDLLENVKRVCETVTYFDSIEEIKEALLFHSLKTVIKSNLSGLEGPYVDLLVNAHNLDRLKKCAEYFLKNKNDLPQEVKTICESITAFHSIEEIEEALQVPPHLVLREENSKLLVNQDMPRSVSQSTLNFFQSLIQDEPKMVQAEAEKRVLQPGGRF